MLQDILSGLAMLAFVVSVNLWLAAAGMISTDRQVHVVVTDAETGAVIDSRTIHDDYLLIAAGEWQVEAFRAPRTGIS